MTNSKSNFFIKVILNRKDPSVPFKIIAQTNESFLSITHVRSRNMDPMNFRKMKLDTIVNALGNDEIRIQKNFQAKTVIVF